MIPFDLQVFIVYSLVVLWKKAKNDQRTTEERPKNGGSKVVGNRLVHNISFLSALTTYTITQ